MSAAYINRIATRTPKNDVHARFVEYACSQLSSDARAGKMFRRLSEMGGIEHRYSVIGPAEDDASTGGTVEDFYTLGSFPSTAKRMDLYRRFAPVLAKETVEDLQLGDAKDEISHVVVTSCTGMSAPGVDLQLIDQIGLSPNVERTIVGFMGCYAAINGFKLARHIVRSEPKAKVLVLNLELCSIHLQESRDLEQILSFFLFADGCAASLVSADPVGFEMQSFHAELAPGTCEHITWNVGDGGFDMFLSGKVPAAIREAMKAKGSTILRGLNTQEIDLWAVHPGGRSVLDAVESGLDLCPENLAASRAVLREYGNMSSPTVVFVLKRLMESALPDQQGCAMAFGPGLVAETMLFRKV